MLDKVCGILDIEAFQHKKLLIYREFAFAPLNGSVLSNEKLFLAHDVLSHSVTPNEIPPPEARDVWYTIRTLKYKIHGLDLFPDEPSELCCPQDAVKWLILGWYEAFACEKRYMIAFKGGNLERNLLDWLNIPYINLEEFGCPSFHMIPQEEREQFTKSCGQHRYAQRGEDHCSIKETSFYRFWTLQQLFKKSVSENPSFHPECIPTDDDIISPSTYEQRTMSDYFPEEQILQDIMETADISSHHAGLNEDADNRLIHDEDCEEEGNERYLSTEALSLEV